MIILIAVYTFLCFTVFKNHTEEKKTSIFRRQNGFMFSIHLIAYLVIFLKTGSTRALLLYAAQAVFLIGVIALYSVLYPKASRLITNNMCMLMSVSFIILTRLSFEKSVKQFTIMAAAMAAALVIPFIISRVTFLKKLGWIYAVTGIALLSSVLVAGKVVFGAKLSLTIGGFSIQPSEFVKIIFVFCVASMLYESTEMEQLIKATAIAGLHVLILVVSRDLGGALILFVVYLIMLYVASRRLLYLVGGFSAGCMAAVAAYFLFSHVRVRVLAWSDPWRYIENEGYQITQSLFAIGTGGWFGMGLFQGMPNKIPVVEHDFVFSAVSEEMGAFFALCLILICVSCFIMFLNIAMQIREPFSRLVALGLGIAYGFQVFLTIGGVTKFIPSTGVTLPLVSYGGSSVFSTLIMFAIIQGLYILRQNEDGSIDRQKQKKNKKTKQQ